MRKLGIAIAILLVLGAGGALLAYFYLDLVVKVALEHYGPQVTGVEVDVEEVALSPRDGRGRIRGLVVGNPGGFSGPRAARFGEIRVALDPSTLRAPVVRIHELAFDAPHITYERGAKATNLDVIQNHIEAYAKRAAAEAASPGDDALRVKRRFVIERLTIRGARVVMTTAGLRGQGISFELPDVSLRDVGSREGGITASEAAGVVARALQERIARKVLTNMDLLRKGGVEGAVDALKELLK